MGDSEHVGRLQESGIDVIITDHHKPTHEVPSAYAIVNPNKDDDDYPNKALCGAGVAFKLVQALITKLSTFNFELSTRIPAGWEKWLLDMVGIATLSDMVSLSGENRMLAYYGLLVLRKSPRIGVRKLLQKLRINQKYITEDDVAFMITPRINAASRMDEPEAAFRLLSTCDESEAEMLVAHLDELNNKRKGAVSAMSKEIHKRVAQKDELPDVLVVGDPHWKPGLLGLAATKAVEFYKRPVFVWGRGDADVIKGSARSYNGVDVVRLMSATRETFLEYGGHTKSGGFSVALEQVAYLETHLNDVFTAENATETEDMQADAILSLDDVTWKLYDDIAQLQPFGMDNPKPVFRFEQVPVVERDTFGKEKNHLKLIFQNSSGSFIQAIQFFYDADGALAQVAKGDTITMLAHVEKSVFGGKPEVRLRVIDLVK